MQGGVQKPKHKVHKHHKSLTLERFAAAKASGYNKQEKKDKEFALNAKKVNQYHKLQRKLQQSGTEATTAGPDLQLHRLQARAGSPAQQSDSSASDTDNERQAQAAAQPQDKQERKVMSEQSVEEMRPSSMHGTKQKGRHGKPETHLQRLARHVQSEKAAVEAAHQAAQKQAEQHRAKVAQSQKQRKQQTSLLRKRTKTGQPVMRHRIEQLLDAIQR